MKPVAVLLLLLVLTGCASADSPSSPVLTPTAKSDRSEVAWDDYGDLKQIVDEDEAAGDCAGLQDAFDVQANRTDSSHVAVMQYIDEALRLADCY